MSDLLQPWIKARLISLTCSEPDNVGESGIDTTAVHLKPNHVQILRCVCYSPPSHHTELISPVPPQCQFERQFAVRF
jgi:hypothetical protein